MTELRLGIGLETQICNSVARRWHLTPGERATSPRKRVQREKRGWLRLGPQKGGAHKED